MSGDQPKPAGPGPDGEKEFGEGNYAASRDYNERTRKFMKEKGDTVEERAREAEDALDEPEGEDLRKAEEEGKSRAKK